MLAFLASKIGGYLIAGLGALAIAGGAWLYVHNLHSSIADLQAKLDAKTAAVAVQAQQLDQLTAINRENAEALDKERADRARAEQAAKQAQDQAAQAMADATALKERIQTAAKAGDVAIPQALKDAFAGLKTGAKP